jgi:hypothetical protein
VGPYLEDDSPVGDLWLEFVAESIEVLSSSLDAPALKRLQQFRLNNFSSAEVVQHLSPLWFEAFERRGIEVAWA